MEIDYEKLDKEAQLGAFSTYDMEVLVPEVQKLVAGDIYMEIGTDKGKSLSVARMVVGKNVSLNAVDINFTDELREYLKDKPDINFMWMSSENAAKVWAERGGLTIHLLFIDGDHSYEGCRRDLQYWSPFLADHATILFHDCDESSPGVVEAVSEFVNKRKVEEWKMFKRTDKNTSMSLIRL